MLKPNVQSAIKTVISREQVRYRIILPSQAKYVIGVLQEHGKSWIARNLTARENLFKLISNRTIGGVSIEVPDPVTGDWVPASMLLYAFLREVPKPTDPAASDPHWTRAILLSPDGAGNAPVLMNADEIARANAGRGLDGFIIKWINLTASGYDIQSAEGRDCLASAFRGSEVGLAGYNLVSMRMQGGAPIAKGVISVGFRIERVFPGDPGGEASPADRFTFAYTREESERNFDGRCLSRLFHYRPPKIGLTAAEIEVLELAVNGLTNEQIGLQLGIGLSAIKNRWERICQRFQRHAPFVLSEVDTVDDRRGGERRRLILNYVTEHPTEIRPYHIDRRRH